MGRGHGKVMRSRPLRCFDTSLLRQTSHLPAPSSPCLAELLGADVVAASASDVTSRTRACRSAVKGANKALDALEARLRRTIAKIVEAEMVRTYREKESGGT